VTDDMMFTMTEQINPALEEKEVLKIFSSVCKVLKKNGWDKALNLSISLFSFFIEIKNSLVKNLFK
jgi:hypothetical protein